MKPLNLLAFLLGLSLAFPLLSHAWDFNVHINNYESHGYVCDVRSDCTDGKWRAFCNDGSSYKSVRANCYTCSASISTVNSDYMFPSVCPAPIPSECGDHVKSPSEDGIDCGAYCGNSCINWCGGDYQLINGVCVSSSLPDIYGNCSSGVLDSSGMCSSYKIPILANEGYVPNDLTPFLNDHFENTPIDTGTNVSTTTVDNGDGTSTVTTTTTTTNNIDNTTVTKTEISNIDNSTGAVISSTTTTVGEKPAEENAGNYNYNVDYGESPVFDSDISGSIPEKVEMSGIIDNFVSSFPLFSILDNQSMNLDNTVCSAPPVNIYGTDLEISLCRFEDFLKSLGVIFVIVAQAAAVFIVVRGWKAS